MSITIPENWKISEDEKRTISLTRAVELKNRISDYQDMKDAIKTGFDMQENINLNKERLLNYFNANEDNWRDWRWQIAHRIDDVSALAALFHFNEDQCDQIKKVGARYRWSISPYFASLIDPNAVHDPVMHQAIPSIEELDESGYDDPMAEEFTSPAPCVGKIPIMPEYVLGSEDNSLVLRNWEGRELHVPIAPKQPAEVHVKGGIINA